MQLRFIDAGTVSAYRSQSVYHGLGYAQKPNTPNTIVVATPETPYMCIGYFQDVEQELDVRYCIKNNLPIIRRETGGGAVYIDKGQLFVQWIFQQNALPLRVDKRFELFIEPLVETYKFFGINAYYHPINDVHVSKKKIVGTGAATIGEGQIVTGNFLFDFNYQTMIHAINVPSDDFRNEVSRNLYKYLTNINAELDEVPARQEWIQVYKKKCENILGLKILSGDFTDEELMLIEKVESKFKEEKWLYQIKKPDAKDKLFKIHIGVWIGFMKCDSEDLNITALITVKENIISNIILKTNKINEYKYSLEKLEKALINVEMEKNKIINVVNRITNGIHVKEWSNCIYKMKKLQIQQLGHGTMARHN